MEHLGGEGSIAGTSSVIPSAGGDDEAAPLSPHAQFSSLGPTTIDKHDEEPPASPPTASEVGRATGVAGGGNLLEPLDELEGQLADVSAVLSSPNGSEHGTSGGVRGGTATAEGGLSPTSMASQSDASVSASSASQHVPAGGMYDAAGNDNDDNDDDGDGLMQFPIERRVPTFDLDDEDETDAQQQHQYPASPDDDASHSTATADETDLMGLFSGDRGMGAQVDDNNAQSRDANAAVPSGNGRIDPDTSGLRLDLDGLSGYEPHPSPSSSSPDDRSKWDEARLTKSSSGGYPVQTLSSTASSRGLPQDVGSQQPSNQNQNQNQNNLPDFVKKAQQRQQQEDAQMQSDSLTPTHANSKHVQQRRRPRPWDGLNETSVHDDTYEDYEEDAANVAENGYVTLAIQQQRDGSVPPTTLQEQPKESTPLLSNQRRRQMRDGSDNIDATSNANGSSWSSVGASMRFRNPLQSRRSATPVSHNGSGSGSGSGNYAASAVASTVHTEATMSTLTSRFKWRPGGDLTAHADNHDDDAQSWTAGSVVKEFVRPLWNRDREDNSDGIGRSASFAYALTNRPQSRATFSFGLAVLCCLHFGSMVVFDLYYLYFNWSTETDGPAAWLSSDGFVANPLIGSPASTLTYFGALSGIRLLLSSEMWRVLTSLTLSTSVIQLALHLSVLRFGTFNGYIAGLERRWSSKATLALYLICCLCGSVCSVALDYPANLTGLVSAGLCGLLSASLSEGWLSSVREMRSDRLGYNHDGSSVNYGGENARSSLSKILLRPGKAHLYIALELVTGIFAHSSLWAATGGLLSGLGCGLFHFSYLLDNRDLRPKSQAYGPSFSTPSKKRHMFGTPPHSPSPSETPPMRRSMMATPEQDENGFGDASSPYRSPSRNNSHFVTTPTHHDDPTSKSGAGSTRFAGFLLALLVGVVPGVLVTTGAVGEAWGGTLDENLLLESSYGCRSMRRLFEATVMSESEYSDAEEDGVAQESEDLWVCSQSCVPLTLAARAARSLNRNGLSMKAGRCKAQGYLCQVGAGFQELHSGRWFIPKALSDPVYDLPMNIYAMPGEDETCSNERDAGTDAEEGGYAENGDDAGAVAEEDADEEDGQADQNIEAQENQMQATAPDNARTSVRIQDIAIDIAEEVVVNAGL